MLRNGFLGMSAIFLAATVAGCDRVPGDSAGQAAATVNGDAISRTDLETEAQGAATTGDAGQRLLAQAVDRKLLAQEAVARKIDATPKFRAAERRARETLLAEALVRRLADTRPDAAAIRTFIARNPAMFAAREVLTLDQLQAPAAAIDGAWLRPANTLAQAASILQAHGVPFERGHATADTAAMPPELLKVLREHPDEPFALPQGDKLVISQVARRQRAAVPAAQAEAIAAREIRRRAVQKAADATLAELRAKAKITYGEGYSAPAAGGTR